MFKFIGPQGCGKSAYCYKQARDKNAYIVVNTSINRKSYLSNKYGIPENHIITVSEILAGQCLPQGACFIIDELEDVIQTLVGGQLIGYSSAEEKYE